MNQFAKFARRVLAFAGVAVLAAGCTIVLPADPPDEPPPPPPPPPSDVLAIWTLESPTAFCDAFTDGFSPNAQCPDAFSTNEEAFGTIFIDSFGQPVQFIDITASDCGNFDVEFFDVNFAEFRWLTPSFESFCTFSTLIFLADGRIEERSLSISVDGGGPPPIPPPLGTNNAFWQLSHDNGFCDAFPGESTVFCDNFAPNGSIVRGLVEIEFQENTRALGIRDNCGGEFLDVFTDHLSILEFSWLTPERGGNCALSLLSVTEDGRVEESIVQVPLADDGEPPRQGLQVFWSLFSSTGDCFVSPDDPNSACPNPLQGGDPAFGFVDFFSDESEVVQAELIDLCGGEFTFLDVNPSFIQFDWIPPFNVNNSCDLVLVTATADGQQQETRLSVTVFDDALPPPPSDIFVEWAMFHANGECHSTGPQARCDAPVLSGDTVFLQTLVHWNEFDTGESILDTNCGGELDIQFNDGFLTDALWLTPQVDEPTSCEFVNITVTPDGEPFTHVMLVTLVP